MNRGLLPKISFPNILQCKCYMGKSIRPAVGETIDETDWTEFDEVVDFGGQLIFAVDETAGGAPIGPTIEELRESEERDNPQAGWARAKRAFYRAFKEHGEFVIGRVRWVGAGQSRDAFSAWIDFPGDSRLSGPYVALLPKSDSDPKTDERSRREALINKQLSSLTLPFKIPRVVRLVPEAGRIVVVRDFVDGIRLDLLRGRQSIAKPWELIATIASAIHGVSTHVFRKLQPTFETRRDFAKAKLSKTFQDDSSESEIRDAFQWAAENIPLPASSTLIHGDLLGQNILLSLRNEATVIDWEYACLADPAWDLAIVTRGVKKPFGLASGLQLLLESYNQIGRHQISVKDIHFYELCLAVGWYHQSKRTQPHSGQVQADLARISAVIRRATTQ